MSSTSFPGITNTTVSPQLVSSALQSRTPQGRLIVSGAGLSISNTVVTLQSVTAALAASTISVSSVQNVLAGTALSAQDFGFYDSNISFTNTTGVVTNKSASFSIFKQDSICTVYFQADALLTAKNNFNVQINLPNGLLIKDGFADIFTVFEDQAKTDGVKAVWSSNGPTIPTGKNFVSFTISDYGIPSTGTTFPLPFHVSGEIIFNF